MGKAPDGLEHVSEVGEFPEGDVLFGALASQGAVGEDHVGANRGFKIRRAITGEKT